MPIETVPFEVNPHAALARKTWGRIFVLDEAHIEIVHEIIREVDDGLEYAYMPSDFVAVWSEEPTLMYGHKFEVNVEEVMKRCFDKGIAVWCVDGHRF